MQWEGNPRGRAYVCAYSRRTDPFELRCWRRHLRVPWTPRRSNQSILKEISLEYSLEGLDAEAETPILWPPDEKNWLIGKVPDAGKDWRQEEKGTTEDEMVGWHHWLNGHEIEKALGIGDGQRSLECCSPWGCKESDTTEQLNWNELIADSLYCTAETNTTLWSNYPLTKKIKIIAIFLKKALKVWLSRWMNWKNHRSKTTITTLNSHCYPSSDQSHTILMKGKSQ